MGDSPERIVQAQGIQVTDPTPEDLERAAHEDAIQEDAVRQAMDALESDATLDQRREAWDYLRDAFWPLPLEVAATIRGAGAGTGEKR